MSRGDLVATTTGRPARPVRTPLIVRRVPHVEPPPDGRDIGVPIPGRASPRNTDVRQIWMLQLQVTFELLEQRIRIPWEIGETGIRKRSSLMACHKVHHPR